MDFKDCRSALNRLGAQPTQDSESRNQADGTRKRFELDLFTQVRLPLSPEDWCSICMNEGDSYLGGCCGSLSRIQDILNAAFRDNGRIKLTTLKNMIEGMVEHGDLDSEAYPFEIPKDLEDKVRDAEASWENLTPIEKMTVTWYLVQGHMTSKQPSTQLNDGPEEALSVLSQGILHLNAHLLISRVMGEADEQPSPVQALVMYRLWPSLKTAYERFQELNPGPMTGWVIINPTQGPEALTTGDIGTSFYKDLEDIKAIVQEWQREVVEHKDIWGHKLREAFELLAVRTATVSVESGLVFGPEEPVLLTSLV